MVKIKFVGKVSPQKIEYSPLPKETIKFHINHWESKIIFSAILSLIIGILFFLNKRYLQNDGHFPFDRKYIIVGSVLGLLLLILHEVLHMLFYPKNSNGVIGIEGLSFFAISESAISRNRFIISALFPSFLLGILPLIISIFIPINMIKINTLLWSTGVVGLATSCQDYVVALYTILHVPHNTMIQYSASGLNYYENTKEK